MADKKNNN